MDKTTYMREYRKTPNGKKSTTFVNWRKGGLVGDYEKIYEKYINTNNCDLCNVFLEGRGGNKKCKTLLKKHGATIKKYKNGRNDIKFTKKKEDEYDKLIKEDPKKGIKILLDIKKECDI